METIKNDAEGCPKKNQCQDGVGAYYCRGCKENGAASPYSYFRPIVKSTPTNDTQRAKNYLKETGLRLTPDAVREALWTGPGHITGATLGRKFRAASTGENPELCREHYVNDKGRTITRYFWNPEYKEIV